MQYFVVDFLFFVSLFFVVVCLFVGRSVDFNKISHKSSSHYGVVVVLVVDET